MYVRSTTSHHVHIEINSFELLPRNERSSLCRRRKWKTCFKLGNRIETNKLIIWECIRILLKSSNLAHMKCSVFRSKFSYASRCVIITCILVQKILFRYILFCSLVWLIFFFFKKWNVGRYVFVTCQMFYLPLIKICQVSNSLRVCLAWFDWILEELKLNGENTKAWTYC